jgi:hypothetical protein
MFDIIYSLNKLIIILINFFKSIKEFNYKLIYRSLIHMDDLKKWYLKKPLVTRTYLTGVMVAFLFNKFNIISYISLFFWPEKLWSF